MLYLTISIGKLFIRFPRMVRDVSMELGKKVKFVTKGDDIEIDRNIFDKIADPMIHLILSILLIYYPQSLKG